MTLDKSISTNLIVAEKKHKDRIRPLVVHCDQNETIVNNTLLPSELRAMTERPLANKTAGKVEIQTFVGGYDANARHLY